MKKLTLLFLLLALSIFGFAQKNFYKISVGAGAGAALAFADLQKKTLSFAAYTTAEYQITPYFSLGLEGQKGELAGGDIIFDPNNRQFINSYLSGTVNFKLSMGEFISDYQRKIPFYSFLSGVYGGVGVGIIKNKISNVRYYGDSFYPGEDSSTDEIIPINLGMNYMLTDKWGYTRYGFNLNFQTNFSLGEGMDGYTLVDNRKDIYSFLSVGVKYHFGFMGLDKRR